ncbi:glycosyltransferase family 4 protein [Ectothiorhodospiraceae bacterium WFHF3C12]|nr:glycosyltransferase family 4 protein [Ectothiorhodospiraceae bacterium WFHF3C12]
MSDREKLAIFSPLPPERTGIADYVYEQLPFWTQHRNITVVVDQDPALVPPVPEGVEVAALADWTERAGTDRVPRLYHVGNNRHHEYVFLQALRHPGVVLLHDYVLHHLTVELTLARGDVEGYAKVLEEEWGELGRRIAEQREAGLFTEYQQFLMPLNGRLVRNSQGVIVHSDWAKRHLSVSNDVPLVCVPHHFSPPPEEVVREGVDGAREYFGMDPNKLIFLCAGHVTPPKRVEHVIRALGEIRDQIPPFELWIVGEASDPLAVERAIQAAGIQDRTTMTGFVEMSAFQYAFMAADVVMNLRYPTAGESSGTLTRALGMGCCCVVYDYASFGDLPSDVAVKLPLEHDNASRLAEALLRVAADDHIRESYARRAAEYARRQCNIVKCVAHQSDFVLEVADLQQDLGAVG